MTSITEARIQIFNVIFLRFFFPIPNLLLKKIELRLVSCRHVAFSMGRKRNILIREWIPFRINSFFSQLCRKICSIFPFYLNQTSLIPEYVNRSLIQFNILVMRWANPFALGKFLNKITTT